MSTAFPFLPRASLIQTAEQGATLITPNRRLARAIKREFDAEQIKRGLSVWPAADILHYSAFLERAWSELARIERGAMLLSEEQETALWERVIADSPQGRILLNPSATAHQAREAWTIRHAFRIDFARYAAILGEDGAAFRNWAKRYEKTCAEKNWLDNARLADSLATSATVLKPLTIVLYGFDELSPQQRDFFKALAASGSTVTEAKPEAKAAPAVRAVFPDADAELYAVASQIKQTLTKQPDVRIGVIVPELAQRRADIVRIFDDVLQPARVVSASRERARPFNISLGLALTDYPLVASALLILELARGELALDEVGSLLRSPFLVAAEQEFTLRALLDAELRKNGQPTVTLKMLAREAQVAPQLAARLTPWIKLAREAKKTKPPSMWGSTFQQLLAGLGWPGERTLDSEEYQTFGKWREIISKLSTLDVIAPRLRFDEALKNLKRLAGDTLFQPESPEVPVQVLGVLEANALEFDLLFATGLTDEAWPQPPNPNPFLPLSVQRKLNVPHARADWQLEFARRTTHAWRACAKDIRFSCPLRDGDRELRPSSLLSEVPQMQPALEDAALYRSAIFASRAQGIETLADFKAPPLPAGIEVKGGAEFFKNQAACPFRAFAIYRLGAEGVEAGHAGLDARDRGLLMHRAAENLWKELKSSKQLANVSEEELRAAVQRAAVAALDSTRKARPDVMNQAFTALEQERVAALLTRLLELEKNRAPFELLAREEKRRVTVAGVEVSTRPDRMDRLEDGSRVILDYKTGKWAGVGDWLGERPDEPQLPLYAVSAGRDDVAAVAFVQLHAQDVLFKGLSREKDLLPGVYTLAENKAFAKQCADWKDLFESWRTMLENLAREYLDGRADVSPKDYPTTCRECDLGALCRVKEIKDRGPVIAEEESDE